MNKVLSALLSACARARMLRDALPQALGSAPAAGCAACAGYQAPSDQLLLTTPQLGG